MYLIATLPFQGLHDCHAK